jgi:hypothetical protein
MTAVGFTTVSSLLKDQTELVKSKGIESFGVIVIDDSEGKHEKVSASNAQLHLFMQLKRGNVKHMIFQSAEQAEIFFTNIVGYYGKDKADSVLSGVSFIAIGDASEYLSGINKENMAVESFEDAITSL